MVYSWTIHGYEFQESRPAGPPEGNIHYYFTGEYSPGVEHVILCND